MTDSDCVYSDVCFDIYGVGKLCGVGLLGGVKKCCVGDCGR